MEELEELAKKFIIGYVPYTDAQKHIFKNIRQMESERNYLLQKVKRYNKVIDTLYQQLVPVESIGVPSANE